jgi:hypothetical protein
MGSISRRMLLAGTSGLLAAPAIVRAQGSNGVALVIGNSKYRWEASLPNAKRDSSDVAHTFEAMGLKTELLHDANQSTIREAIDKLGSAARGVGLAMFYFAGHGAQWVGDAYLVPVDADLNVPKTDDLVFSRHAVKATAVARLGINVFDNCRNNPADGWKQKEVQDLTISRSGTNEQKKIIGPRFNLWSTMSGHVAVDGPPGQNSPFAVALLQQLDGDLVDTSTLAPKLRRDLIIATQGRQLATEFNAYDQPHSFRGARLGRRASDGGVDASRIRELTKAYSFASDNGMFLPEGLVAIRPQGNSRFGQMVGSFKFTEKYLGDIRPVLLVVVSVDENGTGQVILSGKDWGGWYRFREVKLSENRLEYLTVGADRVVFDWRGADGGSFSRSGGNGTIGSFSGSFTRLDG